MKRPLPFTSYSDAIACSRLVHKLASERLGALEAKYRSSSKGTRRAIANTRRALNQLLREHYGRK